MTTACARRLRKLSESLIRFREDRRRGSLVDPSDQNGTSPNSHTQEDGENGDQSSDQYSLASSVIIIQIIFHNMLLLSEKRSVCGDNAARA